MKIIRHGIAHFFVNAAGLLLASEVLSGISFSPAGNFSKVEIIALAALVFSLANLLVRPVMRLIAMPVMFVSLGLFIFVINAMIFGGVAFLIDGFEIASIRDAVLGSIFISIFHGAIFWVFPEKK